jgi:predicted MFS family arabinose efflux permease
MLPTIGKREARRRAATPHRQIRKFHKPKERSLKKVTFLLMTTVFTVIFYLRRGSDEDTDSRGT